MKLRPERLLGVLIVLALAAVLVGVVAIGTAGPGSDAAPSASSGRAGELERGLVVGVADGDTITVQIGGGRERVRYVGVDAPEVASDRTGGQAECGADAATDRNRSLVMGEEVGLERDVNDRDRFDRLLRHVWIERDGGRLLVGEELVSEGLVEARSYPPDTRYDARLQEAERVARDAGAGIWGSCSP